MPAINPTMDKAKEEASLKIFKRVLFDIKPSEAEIRDTTYNVNKLINLLKKIVPKDVELLVAGSIARGTNLKGNSDIDLFMLFNKKLGRDKVVKLGLEYGKAAAKREKGRYEIKYAEHPYIRLYLDSIGMKVDLVPALKIDSIEEMGTTVDRTPLHNEFINSSLNAKQRDDVRILKYLLKAHGIYGAEVKTNGFSGYLCELLIHHYGSINALLESASKFKLPILIEPKERKESISNDAAKRFNSQFIVIDPVDSNRNVAAGVSLESLGKFVLVSRKFTGKPSIDLFYGPKFSSEQAGTLVSKFAESLGIDTFIMVCNVKDKSEDVVYPQLRKVNQQIIRHLNQGGFNVYLSMQFVFGLKGILFIAAPKQSVESRILKGPSAFIPGASQDFIRKHKGAHGFIMRESEIYAIEKTDITSIAESLRKLPKNLQAHKDVTLSASNPIINKIPKEYSVLLYSELQKKISI
ncbi:MAG: CCA tRNA nucleotidyltransferase [Candidatus Micrarchaeaceae archaeon]